MKNQIKCLPPFLICMRIFFCILLLIIVFPLFSAERSDSSKTKLAFSGNISLNSNGIAPIPSFSLDKPAIIATFALQKKRFSFDPQISYGFDLRPWLYDIWTHYRIIYRPSFELRAGINFGMIFLEYDTEDYKVLQGQQYMTLELSGIYKISPKSSVSLMYWNDNGQDPGTIDGTFIDLVYDRTDFKVGETLLLSLNIQFFYIGYTGDNDGLFISPRISSSVKKLPLSLFFQATQPLITNIDPYPGFKWNVGMAYMF
jgi:hypothetical protein